MSARKGVVEETNTFSQEAKPNMHATQCYPGLPLMKRIPSCLHRNEAVSKPANSKARKSFTKVPLDKTLPALFLKSSVETASGIVS